MKQTEEVTVDIIDVGSVLFKKSRRCKGVSIKLKPFNLIEVLYPANSSIKKAMEFVNSKKKWILSKQEVIKKRENLLTVFDENTQFNFKTNLYKLKIKKHSGSEICIKSQNGIIIVYYPENMPVSNELVQKKIREGITKVLRIEANKILPEKTAQMSSLHGFNYKKITVKNLKTRWGSCSVKNNINFNIHLMRLPDHLIDYVILHELCHTVEKNHGLKFWSLLNKLTDNKAKTLSKEMNSYSTFIY